MVPAAVIAYLLTADTTHPSQVAANQLRPPTGLRAE